jgi:hypothetical protein
MVLQPQIIISKRDESRIFTESSSKARSSYSFNALGGIDAVSKQNGLLWQ